MRRVSPAIALLGVAAAAGFGAPPAAAACDLEEHRVNVYSTTVAADVVSELNAQRAALGRAPLTVDRELWLKAMWRAGRTAASGASIVFGPDPCPGDAEPFLPTGRSFSRPDSTAAILDHQYMVETGRLEALLAPSMRSIAIGIAYAFFHTTFVVYASERPAPPFRNEAPFVASETLRFTPAALTPDLAPALLANDRDDDGLVHIVAAETAHGRVSLGWASVRSLGVFYEPDPDFSGNETLTYTVADAFGATTTRTATLVVGRAPDAGEFRLRIGAAGNRVVLKRLRQAYVGLTAPHAGPVLLEVRQGLRTIGTLSTRVPAGRSSLPLRPLLGPRARPGAYTLVGAYGGRFVSVRFSVV